MTTNVQKNNVSVNKFRHIIITTSLGTLKVKSENISPFLDSCSAWRTRRINTKNQSATSQKRGRLNVLSAPGSAAADPSPAPSTAFGTGNGPLRYGINTRCSKRPPVVRDAFSEAFGVKNRLLRYGTDIRYRKRPPMVRDASPKARRTADSTDCGQPPMVRDAFSIKTFCLFFTLRPIRP